MIILVPLVMQHFYVLLAKILPIEFLVQTVVVFHIIMMMALNVKNVILSVRNAKILQQIVLNVLMIREISTIIVIVKVTI